MTLCGPANLFRVLGSGKGMLLKVLNESSCWKLFFLLGREAIYFHYYRGAITVDVLAVILPPGRGESASGGANGQEGRNTAKSH